MNDIRPMAERLAIFFSEFYRRHRFDVEVPYPMGQNGNHLSDVYFGMKGEIKQALFYRPATTEVSFVEMMDAMSGTQSWTEYHLELFDAAAWEPTKRGYWFWVDTGYKRELIKREEQISQEEAKTLMSLEEYIIFYYALMSSYPRLESPPHLIQLNSWLRTRITYNNHPHLITARGGTTIGAMDKRPGYIRSSVRHPYI